MNKRNLSKILWIIASSNMAKSLEHTKRGWLQLIRARVMEDRYNPKAGIGERYHPFMIFDVPERQ